MDKVYRNVANSKWFDSYWLTDVGASYPLPAGVRVSVHVNNLFNASYFNQALGDQMVPSMPRNYMVSLAYRM